MSESIDDLVREVTSYVTALQAENAKLREENDKLLKVIDDITEVVEVSDPALVQFIAKRMERVGIEEDA